MPAALGRDAGRGIACGPGGEARHGSGQGPRRAIGNEARLMAEMALPTGRRGQVLAVAIVAVALMVLWFGIVLPLAGWHAARGEAIERQRALVSRMEALAASLPALRQRAATLASGPAPQALLEGSSDAVAGAALQEQVQAMAVEAGSPLTSAEALPAEPAGAYRRIGLRVALSAPYPVLVHLLAAIADATPRMLVDDLQVQAPPLGLRSVVLPMDATLTVLAFRAKEAAAGPTPARGVGARPAADAKGPDARQDGTPDPSRAGGQDGPAPADAEPAGAPARTDPS